MSRGAVIRLRTDCDGARLRGLAKRSRGGAQAGRRRGVGLQIIRVRALRFHAEGPDGLITRKGLGLGSHLTDERRAKLRGTKFRRAKLRRAVEEGPKPLLDGAVRWRPVDLAQWAREGSGARHWDGSCAPWVSAVFRLALDTTRGAPKPSRRSGKLHRSGHGHPYGTGLAVGADPV